MQVNNFFLAVNPISRLSLLTFASGFNLNDDYIKIILHKTSEKFLALNALSSDF